MKLGEKIFNDFNIKKILCKNKKNIGKGTNKIKYITIHETGNTNRTANAHAHTRFLESQNCRVSWHYTVDCENIIQHFEDDTVCWHTATTKGNNESIGIEICVNDQLNFLKTLENAQMLILHLMFKYSIYVYDVVTHESWSKKKCPYHLLTGVWGTTWEEFKLGFSPHNVSPWAQADVDWGIQNNITDGLYMKYTCSREMCVRMCHNLYKLIKGESSTNIKKLEDQIQNLQNQINSIVNNP